MLVARPDRSIPTIPGVSPFWVRVQVLIVVFVLAGMIVAVTKLA